MGRFLEAEKLRQVSFKTTSPYFSSEARSEGVYKGRPRPFCLPRAFAVENLFSEIRQVITAYFAAKEIKWHDGRDGNPSNHLCDSQVCCANFLFPFADKPRALAALLHPVFPEIQQMLPMEDPGQFVSFEWIGLRNYLGERIPRHGKRIRGANFTSTDAAVMFERQDGERQIVLIEWKYTESYSRTPLKVAKSGTDRTVIYAHLYEREDFPLDKELLPSFEALFYEPFYQLFQQQALAHEMERARELGVKVVSLLHIAPAHNTDFQRVTSPALRAIEDSVMAVWKRLVQKPHGFMSISTEELYSRFPVAKFPRLAAWWEHTIARYSWIHATA